MRLIITLLALVTTAATQTPSPSTCTNTDLCVLSCAGCANGELVHDPEDCHNYYMCLNDQPLPELPLTCPGGQHFNATTHQCVDGDECVSCVGGSCHYQCKKGDDYHFRSHQLDCSTYVLCHDGQDSLTLSCPEDRPYFDGSSCQTDESKCCSCRPYCTQDMVNKLTYDPVDCTKYYLCTTTGFPELFGVCPSGENFDLTSMTCSQHVGCHTPPGCFNVAGADGCVDVWTCQAAGVFARCETRCVPEYYSCTTTDIGHRVDPLECIKGRVYHLTKHQCVLQEDCTLTQQDPHFFLNNDTISTTLSD